MQTTDRDEQIARGESWGIVGIIVLVLIAAVSAVIGNMQGA